MVMSKTKSDRFHLISLGCSKNTVDSESMATLLNESGMRATEKAKNANVLIVNTCGFIGPAKEESIRTLNELAATKRKGQMLIAAGCLSQRYGSEVLKWSPGVDGVIGPSVARTAAASAAINSGAGAFAKLSVLRRIFVASSSSFVTTGASLSC